MPTPNLELSHEPGSLASPGRCEAQAARGQAAGPRWCLGRAALRRGAQSLPGHGGPTASEGEFCLGVRQSPGESRRF